MAKLNTTKLHEAGEWLVDQLLEVGIHGAGPARKSGSPTFKGAIEVAEEHLVRAGNDRELAIKKLIATHVRLAAASGFVTGAGGLVTLPISLPAALTGLYVTAARMVAGIAYLRGHDVHSEEVHSAILVSLLGSGASTAFHRTGVEVGKKSTLAALQKVPGKVLIDINKRVGYRLVTKAGERGIVNLTKLVPLVGAPIGATVDGVGCKGISVYALRVFEPVTGNEAVVVDGEVL